MAAISRRGQGGRIYNNTRARVLLRRKCVNPRRPHKTFPAKSLRPPPHSDTLFPSIFSLPSRALPLPHAAPTHTRRLRHAFPAEDLRSPPLFRFGHKKTAPHSGCAMHSPPTPQPIPRRRPSLAPTQRHALAEHFRSPTQRQRTPAGCAMHFPPTSQPIPRRRPSPAPAQRRRPSPQRHAASPFVPLRAQKNGTAQWMCDAECLGRPSLRSVIGVGEPRAVRRRYGALAWRVGLRPQPWALRSRRCGRVLRA